MTETSPESSPPPSLPPGVALTLQPPPVLRCPRCGRSDLALEPRRGTLDRLAAIAFWRPLRCRGCGRRFRRFVSRSEAARLRG